MGEKGVTCMLTEDVTLGGEHRMQYTDVVLLNCAFEMYTCL